MFLFLYFTSKLGLGKDTKQGGESCMKHHLTSAGKAKDRPPLDWKGSQEVSSQISCLKKVLLEKVV